MLWKLVMKKGGALSHVCTVTKFTEISEHGPVVGSLTPPDLAKSHPSLRIFNTHGCPDRLNIQCQLHVLIIRDP